MPAGRYWDRGHASYDEDTVQIAAGDILVMYTDGLVERDGMDLETGLARAAQIIADWDVDAPIDYCAELEDHRAAAARRRCASSRCGSRLTRLAASRTRRPCPPRCGH